MPPKPTTQMHLSEHRLASFDPITKPKSKARPGWPLKKETHPLLTPENMVGAGFFYKPGGEDGDDSCVCFTCEVTLGGWAEDDDPYKEHAKRGDCAWAETICQLRVDKANGAVREYTTQEDLPSSATYSQIRENTYYSKDRITCYWPHIKNKRHLVTPQALAQAGFVFTPSGPSSDLVKCPICEYDVEEWDEDDDPMEQHRRKHPECLFFTAQITKGKAKRAPRPTKKTKPTEIESETEIEAIPSKSTRRTRNQTSEEPSQSQPTQKTKTRPKRGKKPEVEVVEEDEVIAVDEDTEVEEEVEEAAEEVVSKPSRGKKSNREAVVDEAKAQRRRQEVEEMKDMEPEQEQESVPISKSVSKSKSKSSKSTSASASTSNTITASISTSTLKESSSGPSKTTTKNSKSKSSRKPAPVNVDEEEVPMAIEVNVPEPDLEVESSQKAAKAKPRTTKASKSSKSKSKNKAVEEVIETPLEEIPSASTAAMNTNTMTSKAVKPLPPLPPPSPAPAPVPAQTGRPLSQLDRFANIPPSSPLSAPLPNRITKPIPKKTISQSQPNRPIPLTLPKAIDKAPSEAGQKVAKEVIGSILSQLPLPLPTPIQVQVQDQGASIDTGRILSEEQLNMTMENWIKAEMRLKREEIEREGREMIAGFESRTREARRKIEGLPTW